MMADWGEPAFEVDDALVRHVQLFYQILYSGACGDIKQDDPAERKIPAPYKEDI